MAQNIEGFKIVFEGVEQILQSYDEINEAHKRELKNLRAIKDTSSETYQKKIKLVADLKTEKDKLNKAIKSEIEKQKGLEDAIAKSVSAYDELKNKVKDAKKNVLELSAAGKENTDEFIAAKAEYTKLNEELTKVNKSYKTQVEKVEKNIGAYKKLSIQLVESRTKLKDLMAAGETNTKEFRELNEEVQRLDKTLKQIDADVGQFQRNVGNYKSHWGRLTNVIGKFPVAGTLATGGMAAIGVAAVESAKIIRDLTNEYVKLRGAINDTFGGTDEEIDEYTIKTSALLNTFNELDQQSLIDAVAALTRQTGDYSESLSLIEKGLLANKGKASEFIEQIKEYPVFLKEAGLEGKHTVELISKAFREGTFNDKGIDAFKEGVISLREQAPATLTALEKIGITSKQLNQAIDEKGIGGALIEVSKKVGEFEEDGKEAAAILAEVFKSAGEDAGVSWIPTLGELDGNLDALIDTTDQYTQNQISLLSANEEFAQSQKELAELFGATDGRVQTLLVRGKTLLLDFFVQGAKDVKDILRPIFELYNAFSNLASNLGISIKVGGRFREVILKYASPLSRAANSVKLLSDEIKNFINRFPRVAKLFKDNKKEVDEQTKSVKRNIENTNKNNKGKIDLIKNQKTESDLVKEATGLYSRMSSQASKYRNKLKDLELAGLKNTISYKDAKKALTILDKKLSSYSKTTSRQTNKQKKLKKETVLATTSIAYMQKELSKMNRELSEAPDQTAMQSIIEKIVETENKINKAKAAIEAYKASLVVLDVLDVDIKLADTSFIDDDISDIENEIEKSENIAIADFEKEHIKKNNEEIRDHAIKTKKEEEQAKNELLSLSIEAARSFSDLITTFQLRPYELERQKIEENYEAKIKAAEGDEELQKELTAKKGQLLDEIDEKEKKIKRQAAIREKFIAGAETLMSTYKAATAAMSVPFPFGQILAGVITGIGLANVAKIAATPIKFRRGGIAQGPSHEMGGIPFGKDEIEGGEAVINRQSTALFKKELSDINSFAGFGDKFERGGITGQAVINNDTSDIAMIMNKMDNWQNTLTVISNNDDIIRDGLSKAEKSNSLKI